MNVRAEEPTQVNADTERVAIKLRRHAPAKIEFQIQVPNRLVIDASIEPIIAHQVCSTRGHAGGGETLAVFGRAAGIAFGGCSAPENPADHRLIPPRRDVISGSREAEIAGIVFETAVELRVISEGNKGKVKNRVSMTVLPTPASRNGEKSPKARSIWFAKFQVA